MPATGDYISNQVLVETVAERLTTRDKVNRIYGKGALDERRKIQGKSIPVIDYNEIHNLYDENDTPLTRTLKDIFRDYFLNRKKEGQTVGFGTHLDFNRLISLIENGLLNYLSSFTDETGEKNFKLIDNSILAETRINPQILPKVIKGINSLLKGSRKGRVIIHINLDSVGIEIREQILGVCILPEEEGEKR